jgi:hypothetical protein
MFALSFSASQVRYSHRGVKLLKSADRIRRDISNPTDRTPRL